MIKSAVISGDIIAYTSLNKDERIELDERLRDMLNDLSQKFNVYGRIIKGDYLECYIPDTEKVLRIALIIKAYIKKIAPLIQKNRKEKSGRLKFFEIYGIRLAIGIGDLSRLDTTKGVMDGEAIYYSGRLISGKETYDKERINVKNSLFIKIYDNNLNDEFIPLIYLLDKIISDATAKQSEILFYKLQNYSENEIAKILNVSQSAVNQHSTSLGWNAVEKSVLRFEEVINKKVNADGYL